MTIVNDSRGNSEIAGEGPQGFGSSRGAALAGLRESIGIPMLVLGASYVGFGSLVHGAGLDVWLGLFSTFTGWALPGQIVAIELYSLRSEEHTSELQSLMRISYAVFCLKKKKPIISHSLFTHYYS